MISREMSLLFLLGTLILSSMAQIATLGLTVDGGTNVNIHDYVTLKLEFTCDSNFTTINGGCFVLSDVNVKIVNLGNNMVIHATDNIVKFARGQQTRYLGLTVMPTNLAINEPGDIKGVIDSPTGSFYRDSNMINYTISKTNVQGDFTKLEFKAINTESLGYGYLYTDKPVLADININLLHVSGQYSFNPSAVVIKSGTTLGRFKMTFNGGTNAKTVNFTLATDVAGYYKLSNALTSNTGIVTHPSVFNPTITGFVPNIITIPVGVKSKSFAFVDESGQFPASRVLSGNTIIDNIPGNSKFTRITLTKDIPSNTAAVIDSDTNFSQYVIGSSQITINGVSRTLSVTSPPYVRPFTTVKVFFVANVPASEAEDVKIHVDCSPYGLVVTPTPSILTSYTASVDITLQYADLYTCRIFLSGADSWKYSSDPTFNLDASTSKEAIDFKMLHTQCYVRQPCYGVVSLSTKPYSQVSWYGSHPFCAIEPNNITFTKDSASLFQYVTVTCKDSFNSDSGDNSILDYFIDDPMSQFKTAGNFLTITPLFHTISLSFQVPDPLYVNVPYQLFVTPSHVPDNDLTITLVSSDNRITFDPPTIVLNSKTKFGVVNVVRKVNGNNIDISVLFTGKDANIYSSNVLTKTFNMGQLKWYKECLFPGESQCGEFSTNLTLREVNRRYSQPTSFAVKFPRATRAPLSAQFSSPSLSFDPATVAIPVGSVKINTVVSGSTANINIPITFTLTGDADESKAFTFGESIPVVTVISSNLPAFQVASGAKPGITLWFVNLCVLFLLSKLF